MRIKLEHLLIVIIILIGLHLLMDNCNCERFSVGVQPEWLKRALNCFFESSEDCEFLDEFLDESVAAVDTSIDTAMNDPRKGDAPAPPPSAAGGGGGGGVLDPITLPLSIQIHEFALFVHYQLMQLKLDFTFYVQPKLIMGEILIETYGELADKKKYEPKELENIRDISEGSENYLWYNDGVKIPFEEILQRYNSVVPELYKFDRVDNSYKNSHGFQLLDKQERENKDKIHAFYNKVRQYFCKISFGSENNYIIKLKEEYPEQNWQDFGTMIRPTGGLPANFDISDVLKFLEYKINNTDDNSNLRRLVKQYVDLFSVEIGDVRNCLEFLIDLKGTYMIVKLRNPELGFVYDNTEMVVHECNFELGIPAQYHVGIMRNPSDLITNKFKKIFSGDKYNDIIRFCRRPDPPRPRIF